MRHRVILLGLSAICGVGGALGAACSSPSDPFEPIGDASADATTRPPDGGPFAPDARAPDSANPGKPDASEPPPPLRDGGSDGRVGRCTPLRGPECDLVAQDCPRAAGIERQCRPALQRDGGVTTQCVNVGQAQSLPSGYPCCVNASNGDPCLKGLSCVGGEDCTDGGSPAGKCTPYCCDGDDAICGSDKEGNVGRCNLMIVGGNSQQSLYQVCSYDAICRPLGVKPCPRGLTCHVLDPSGSARCSTIFAPDGGNGLGFRQPCPAGNACAEGLECLGNGDAGSYRCEYLCHVNGTVTPFDAGALSSAPGRGGCPSAAPRCVAVPNLYPPWLGICQ